jgi:hypothetical protein
MNVELAVKALLDAAAPVTALVPAALEAFRERLTPGQRAAADEIGSDLFEIAAGAEVKRPAPAAH